MILVDVYVPSLDARYDCIINETVSADLLKEELLSMVCQKENLHAASDSGKMAVWHAPSGMLLSGGGTIADAGVAAGDTLILV